MKYYANHDLLTTAYSQWQKVFIADLLIYYKTIISLSLFFLSRSETKPQRLKE